MRLSKKARRVCASVAGTIIALVFLTSLVDGSAVLARGQGNSANAAGDKDSLAGNWDLIITTRGVEAQQNEAPTVITIQETGNKLTGKVAVPNVIATGASFQTQGARDLALTDLKYNGKKLSFVVSDEDNQLIAELSKVNDDEFAGTWRSPINERWKGAKSEFAGTLKMKRKK